MTDRVDGPAGIASATLPFQANRILEMQPAAAREATGDASYGPVPVAPNSPMSYPGTQQPRRAPATPPAPSHR